MTNQTPALDDAHHAQGQADSAIEKVEVWTSSFELRRPLVLQNFTIREREYVVVRTTTASGVSGLAYSLTRGLPIERLLRTQIVPMVVGQDAFGPTSIRNRLENALSLVRFDGIVQRAISLIDITLWDAKARALDIPLWRLLGGAPVEKPILLVDAYAQEGDTAVDRLNRLSERAADGYRAIKLHSSRNRTETTNFLGQARAAVGDEVEIVVDAAMEFRTPTEAATTINQWVDARLAWVEDPFHADRVEWIAQLKSRTSVPLGAGDDVANTDAMRRLATQHAVDVLRLDATVHGGISGVLALIAHAAAEGLGISLHVYPEIHHHLATARQEIDYVEAFAPATEYDAAERFVASEALMRQNHGVIKAADRPGLGFEIDWKSLEANRVGY